MRTLFDHYIFRARLTPAFISGLPAALAFIVWFPTEFWGWSAFWAFLVAAGCTTLLSEIGRDRGKQKERALWDSWGGASTTRHLRHAGPLDVATRGRYHDKLRQFIPALAIPGPTEERANPQEADNVYESCINWLKERTRDQKNFPLVYKELVSYGFRRNLWALKPIALIINILAFIAIASRVYLSLYKDQTMPALLYPAAAVTGLLLLVWLSWIRPGWIRIPADGYAQRLLATLETIPACARSPNQHQAPDE